VSIVFLPDGSSYEGDAVLDAGAVTVEGRLVVKSTPDVERPLVRRTWPIARVSEIRWDGDE
jgi:hypothetical protein